MKKLIIIILAILPFLFSCSKEPTKGCMDDTAINHDSKAEKDDGSCIYPTITFYGDSTHWKGILIDYIKIEINGSTIGTFSGSYENGTPSCGVSNTASYVAHQNETSVFWNSTIYFPGGSHIYDYGEVFLSASQPCVTVNVIPEV